MVIDELLVVLGLDARQFNEEQRRAIESFRKTQQAADEFSKNVERNGAKLSEVFRVLRGGALGIMGAFVGSEVAGYINHMANMDAATGRFAKTIGTAVENLSTWQNMIRMRGGDAGAATSVLSGLQQQIESVRQGSGMFEGGFATLLNRSGATLRDDADTTLRKIRGYIAGEMGAGRMSAPEAATWLRRVPGMNEDMLSMLSLSTAQFNALADAAKKAGTANEDSAKAGQLLTQAFTNIVLVIENGVRKLTPLFELLTKPLDKLGFGDVKSAGKSILDIDRATGMQVGELPGTRAVREWLFGPDKKKADGGDMDAYKAAIAMIESRGSGGYSAIGPVTRTGDRAYGKYQVMGANIPEWSKDATGRSMTPAEFLASPETQEAVFKKQFGKYVEKYGASGAAAAWFAGEKGMSNPNARDAVGTSVSGYVSQFNRNLGGAAAAAGRASDGARGGGDIKSDVSINNININAPNATDAEGISKEIGPAIKRSSIAAPANYGLV